VSKARISIFLNRDKPAPFFAVLEANRESRRRKHPLSGLGPLDEDDCVVEVRLEIAPLCRGEASEAEEIEV
jgi:hypothetical protein